MRIRRLFFNAHLYVALVAALFVTILGLTGSIMAFEPELLRLADRPMAYVTPLDRPKPLGELITAVERAYPREPVRAFTMPPVRDQSYVVSTEKRAVYVDQYRGTVLGEVGPAFDVIAWVHSVHLRLGVRNRAFPGKEIVTWAGVAMLFLLLSGLYLWWPLKPLRVRWSGATRKSWFDLHNAAGIVSYLFLLVLTVTGLSIGFESATTPLYYRLTGSAPSKMPRDAIVAPAGATMLSPDSVVRIAATAVPGALPYQIALPGAKQPYEIRSRFPEDRTPGGRSRVLVHPYTGAVLFAEGSRTAPAGARIVTANRAIHTGDIYGLPTKILMALASLMAVAQVVTGLMMLWHRSRPREPASTGPPPAATA